MQKVKRKQVLKPVLKPQPLPLLGPFVGTKKSKKRAKNSALSGRAPGWNMERVAREDMVKFLNNLTKAAPGACMLYVHILPVVGTIDASDVVFFVAEPQK